MTLGVSISSVQPFFAHIPIFNSNHTYQHIHIHITSTDPDTTAVSWLKDTLWAFDLVDFGPDTTRGGKGLNAPMAGVVLGVCTSQDSLRFPNERGWMGLAGILGYIPQLF